MSYVEGLGPSTEGARHYQNQTPEDDGPGTLSAQSSPRTLRGAIMRTVTLVCVCSLSIGAHFARDTMGPLKSKLGREMGTSNAQFSLLLSAFSLNSTWTPLLGGLLANQLGTAYTSLLATGCIFIGQVFVLVGNITGSLHMMVGGMFIYGLGVSPLSVVQEAIIVRFFRDHGLGLSMACGLVAGKFASFVAARTSFPLSEQYGVHGPMTVATLLSAFSLGMNLVYISVSRVLERVERAHQQETSTDMSEAQALAHVTEKRKVRIKDLSRLGDVFWAYIAVNFCCGLIWQPFNQLSANILQQRYHLSESDAGKSASYLHAGSVVLYPICGLVIDRVKTKGMAIKLFITSSCLTLLAYIWLAIPASITKTPVPAIAAYATAVGYSPLLLAVIVPQLVPAKYVATTLGAHKSIEKVGETLLQTCAGLILDSSSSQRGPSQSPQNRIQALLNLFVFMNFLHICSVLLLQRLHTVGSGLKLPDVRDENNEVAPLQRQPTDEQEDAEDIHTPFLPPSGSLTDTGPSQARGRVFMRVYFGFIVLTWIVFLITAWSKLKGR